MRFAILLRLLLFSGFLLREKAAEVLLKAGLALVGERRDAPRPVVRAAVDEIWDVINKQGVLVARELARRALRRLHVPIIVLRVLQRFAGDRVAVVEQPVAHGLGIEIHRGRQGVDMSARVGVYQGQPMVTVRDGRESDDNAAVRKKLSPALMRDSGAQQLELRVVPNGADDARQMILQVYFNNALVHSQQLKLLTRSTNTALKTIVFTSGNKRASTDVAFDNYQLERRKEAR